MKYTVFLLLALMLILIRAESLTAQNDSLNKTIVGILNAFSTENPDEINRYIHPDYGLIVLFRRGVMDEYQKTDTFGFDNPIPEYLPYSSFVMDSNIRFQELPQFSCDSLKWNKTGLYCDTTQRDHLLSQTALNLKTFRNDPIPSETIDGFKTTESKSHRVVLVDPEGTTIIFYITLIDNKWYLTILDRASGDCSA